MLIGLITAASLQYAAALGELVFTTFSLRFLFIPLLLIVLFWVWNYITTSPSGKAFIRLFVWFYGLFTLLNDILFFLVLSFLKQLTAWSGVIIVTITSIVLYGVAAIIDIRIMQTYGYRRHELMSVAFQACIIAIAATALTIFLAYQP